MTVTAEVDHHCRRCSVSAPTSLLLLLAVSLAGCTGEGEKRLLPEVEPGVQRLPSELIAQQAEEQPLARPVDAISGNAVSATAAEGRKETAEQPGMILKTFNSLDPYLPAQVEFINSLLRFAETVTVLSEVEDGPLFDPGTQEIWMPGSFADVIEAHFGEADAPVADVYLHTLVHEVGHVLYDQYDLPLLAREEDAADALASVLLLEYAQNGARVVLNAARMFGLESETSDQVEEVDFWSEHSLDIQRYYTTLCHVYGSDPDGQARLVNDEYGLSKERAENCEYEYRRIRQAWLKVLEPYLKR